MPPDSDTTWPDEGPTCEPQFDFDRSLRTNGFEPADEAEGHLHDHFLVNGSDFRLLAAHHGGDHSFAVLHDRAATWDVPGTADLLAVHVVRDRTRRTFRLNAQRMPLVSLAQQWLVARGCPSQAIVLPPGSASEPADEATTTLEAHLRSSPGRYTLIDHYTHDSEPFESWALMRDARAEPATAPFRLFIEAADIQAGTYTLREGAFGTEGAAREWLDERNDPLPAPLHTARPPTASRPAVTALPRMPGPRR
ncbi:glycosyl hydrolase [Streptomyces sp. HPF1205]|uniref:glycosyl hydrolase n=1 Tax=Streptomyces sp. HPF1205 TaxID=2873262 RepID=UPI001CECC8CE|nr:glycosyl hydrolase [Streptomyces sp. HPF1205]